MHSFIYRTLKFVFPVIILLCCIEALLQHIPNDYAFKNNYLKANSNNIEVLFLGNSHVYFGVNPEYLSYKSFNASHISQSLNYDAAILKKYKHNLKQLKFIVVPVDYFSLYATLEDGIEKWRVKNYSIYYSLAISGIPFDLEIMNGKFTDHIKRLKSYYLHHKSDITCNKLGWGTTYNSKDNSDLTITGKTAAKRHTLENNREVFNSNIGSLKYIIEYAVMNKVKVIFFTSPAYKTYTENLNQAQLHNTITTIHDIVRLYSETKYYNLLSDTSFTSEDFFDGDHLNEIGAKKLTLKLDSLIRIND